MEWDPKAGEVGKYKAWFIGCYLKKKKKEERDKRDKLEFNNLPRKCTLPTHTHTHTPWRQRRTPWPWTQEQQMITRLLFSRFCSETFPCVITLLAWSVRSADYLLSGPCLYWGSGTLYNSARVREDGGFGFCFCKRVCANVCVCLCAPLPLCLLVCLLFSVWCSFYGAISWTVAWFSQPFL